jgi:hypothetical protein
MKGETPDILCKISYNAQDIFTWLFLYSSVTLLPGHSLRDKGPPIRAPSSLHSLSFGSLLLLTFL